MKRLQSIDTFRGLSLLWMFLGHLTGWWLVERDVWFAIFLHNLIDPIGSSAFIFIAGVSTMLSYRKRMGKTEEVDDYEREHVKHEYLFRGVIFLIVGFTYNIFIAIGTGNITYIWSWFVLFTIAFSLLLGWPLLHTSKAFRVFIVILLWTLNEILLIYLGPFEGQLNIWGVIYHLLYNSKDLDIILVFFPYFIMGTVIGELLFDAYLPKAEVDQKNVLKNEIVKPLLIIGPILIIIGVIYEFPSFFIENRRLAWQIYTMGIILTLLAIFVATEDIITLPVKKEHKFLYYYSYYSLTTYLAHNILYFLFLDQLTIFNIWFFLITTVILWGLMLRFIHKKWGANFSLKYQVARIAKNLTLKVDERRKKELLIKTNI